MGCIIFATTVYLTKGKEKVDVHMRTGALHYAPESAGTDPAEFELDSATKQNIRKYLQQKGSLPKVE